MINIIAAVSANGVIGVSGRIPWSIPADMAHFKELTTGGAVIMGRYTYESIGRPLPERFNIVVSRKSCYSGDELATVPDIESAIKLAKKERSEIFLCGGERIYSEGIRYAQRLYLTLLDDEYCGDAYFPEFDHSEFRLTKIQRDNENKLTFCTYLKK